VTRNYVLSDFVTKTAYFSLAAAAFVFVSMLMMTASILKEFTIADVSHP
jgi:hypothetical protein